MIARRLGALCAAQGVPSDPLEEPETLDTGWLEELTLFAKQDEIDREEARENANRDN